MKRFITRLLSLIYHFRAIVPNRYNEGEMKNGRPESPQPRDIRVSAPRVGLSLLLVLALPGCWVGPNPSEMVLIPAGEFIMGFDKGEIEERPQRRVKLKAFTIDKYPVTYGRYETFIRSTGYPPPRDWDGKPEAPSGKTLYPVVYVSWDDAVAFCRWEGKRLPAEEEWEKAGRGTDGRLFPWGNEWQRSRSNLGGDGTLRVGSYPGGASPFGVMDMVGSVWQWTSSTDRPAGAGQKSITGWADNRIVRGPAFSNRRQEGRVTMRMSYNSHSRANTIGCRCARDKTGPGP